MDRPAAPDPPHPDAAALRDWLASRDSPCPVCSYNLRALSVPVCPECAARLHLQVGSTNLHIGAWLLAVVSLALALGFDGVVAILLAIGLSLHPPPMPGPFQMMLMILASFLALAAGSLAGILLMVRRRPRWNRLSTRAQWRLGIGIFVGVGLGHAAFGWAVSTRFF